MNFVNGKELLVLCKLNRWNISKAMLEREKQIFKCSEEEIIERMTHAYDIMKHGAERALREELELMDGSSTGESKRIFFNADKKSVCGELMSKAISYAIGILEVNESMGLIVAAPTPNSSGIVPGTFLAMQERFELSDEAIIKALFTAGAVGYLMTHYMMVLDLKGDYQMEIGMASAMAAAGVCEVMGGTPEMVLEAATYALRNISGTCIENLEISLTEQTYKQNHIKGVSNALVSAEMILCGLKPIEFFDEILEAVIKVS